MKSDVSQRPCRCDITLFTKAMFRASLVLTKSDDKERKGRLVLIPFRFRKQINWWIKEGLHNFHPDSVYSSILILIPINGAILYCWTNHMDSLFRQYFASYYVLIQLLLPFLSSWKYLHIFMLINVFLHSVKITRTT